MSLYFITGSASKLSEVKAILADVEQLGIDLPEIQDIDPHTIIRAKLEEARKHQEGDFIVEDTSLYFDALNGLPGPLIKWFMKTVGNDGLYKIAEAYGNFGVEAKTIVGYSSGDKIEFFEGSIRGSIVKPRGETGFGWDPIFEPTGYDKTFAELEPSLKNSISMRKVAVEKLKTYLQN
ncbi:MAG: non-canonical purine NTP pyrophosphatase [Patescibacteria group bacterium]